MKKNLRILLLSFAVFIVIAGGFFVSSTFAATNTQTIKIKVVATEPVPANPGIYWYQLDDGTFRADTRTGAKIAKNMNNVPHTTLLRDQLDLSNYTLPSTFQSTDGTLYPRINVSRLYILKNSDIQFVDQTSFKGVSVSLVGDSKVDITTYTGHDYTFTKRERYGTRLGTSLPKYNVFYETPLEILWSGEVEETKEIRVVEDSTLRKGATKQYRAEVRTKLSGGSWSSWVDVTNRTETKWSTSNSSVATVSSSGLVTAKTNGTATIKAQWNNGTYDIQDSATVQVTEDDSLFISGSSSNVCLPDPINLTAKLTKKDGSTYNLTAHSNLTWSSSNTSVATVSSGGKVTPNTVGTTTITAKFVDSSQGINVTDTMDLEVYDCSVSPPPSGGGETTEPNDPPTVQIVGPTSVKAGDEFCIRANAQDQDGTIEQYGWGTPSMMNAPTTTDGSCGVYYMEEGTKTVTVVVVDNDGATATDTHTIQVLPPTPVASLSVGGTLKENRKVTITSTSSSPTHYPIQWANSYITVKPLDGQSLEVMKTTGSGAAIKDGKMHVSNVQSLDSLYKLKGRFEVEHYVINTAGLSHSVKQEITIKEDLKPIAEFSVATFMYRERDLNNYATFNIRNNAYSEDDLIGQVIYEVIYDNNNDGIFDETPVKFDSATMIANQQYEVAHSNGMKVYGTLDDNQSLELLVPRVGQYKIYQEVIESFGQPTIEQFIVESDYRRMKTD